MSVAGDHLVIPPAVIVATMEHLRSKGRVEEEGVVLWRGTLSPARVIGVIVPEQETGVGRFIVPLRERHRISRELAGTGEVIVAQVHSHPGAAFHSPTDDTEAIPRRVGAYSLVVPDCGSRSSIFDGAALFQLSADGSWRPVPIAVLRIATTRRKGIRWLIGTLKSFVRSRI
jgi:hypothetical protein